MKKILISALACLALAFTSCSGDGDGGGSSTGSMSAKIDGQSWSTNLVVASVSDFDIDGSGTALQLLGTKMDQTSFTLSLPVNGLTVGSHVFSGSDAEGSLSYINSAFEFYDSAEDQGSFTLNITDIDVENGRISGTFSGTLVSFDETQTITITEGKFNNVILTSNSLYSDGTMSLTRDNGTAFTMDETQEDGKYLLIGQATTANGLTLFGYNTTLTSDFGIYNISMPLDVQPGTYSLTSDSGFSAGLSANNNDPEFNITSGSITITSHNGNNLVGTFNFTANNGATTVHVNNGSFDITHK